MSLAEGSRDKTKAASFEAWLKAKPYWEQYLWQIHLEKGGADEADLDECYHLLLEDCGAEKIGPGRRAIAFPVFEVDDTEIPATKSTLNKIENLKNVNAIDENSIIEFDKELTIIYGDNGTGKSGIGRLLSNACLSRKPRKLLPNARRAVSSSALRPSADFHISTKAGVRTIKFKLGDLNPELKAFAVFDHECALIHLDSENRVEFVPSKIQIFDDVFKSISALEERLEEETSARECEDPTDGIFDDAALVAFLGSLSHETTHKKIDEKLKFTAADKATLTEKKKIVSQKLKQDTSAQKALLREQYADLQLFKSSLVAKATVLSGAKAAQINRVLREIRQKKDVVEKLSAKSFNFASFKHVGSAEWKAFILAAHKLHQKESASNGAPPEHCLLCRQPLKTREKTLFEKYWEFLRSTAESELVAARRTLASYVSDLQNADQNWPTFSSTEAAVKTLKKEAAVNLKKIEGGFAVLKVQLAEWIAKLNKEQDVTYVDPKIALEPISKAAQAKRNAESKLIDPGAEIRKLNGEIVHFEQKQQASRLIPKIKKYVEWLRWDEATSGLNLPAVRGATTRKKTEIMGEMVISRYIKIFNKEVERLDCDFGLEVESYGKDANTIKGLKLEFARRHSPSDILSEGEQTVSALADFLTEAKLDNSNSGIIFDDPVTSLDHSRREVIARRLAEEAKERQVVVLTHDIAFLLELQQYADRIGVHYLSVSMRKSGDSVGLIKPELPWIAQHVKTRVGYLKNRLPVLKKAEAGDPDEYREQVKSWYGLLRESWERAVEERLFKGVVQRFSVAIQTQRLDRVEVSPELIKEVIEGMTESSNWLHDTGAGKNPKVPDNAKLSIELNKLERFVAKCAAP